MRLFLKGARGRARMREAPGCGIEDLASRLPAVICKSATAENNALRQGHDRSGPPGLLRSGNCPEGRGCMFEPKNPVRTCSPDASAARCALQHYHMAGAQRPWT